MERPQALLPALFQLPRLRARDPLPPWRPAADKSSGECLRWRSRRRRAAVAKQRPPLAWPEAQTAAHLIQADRRFMGASAALLVQTAGATCSQRNGWHFKWHWRFLAAAGPVWIQARESDARRRALP